MFHLFFNASVKWNMYKKNSVNAYKLPNQTQ